MLKNKQTMKKLFLKPNEISDYIKNPFAMISPLKLLTSGF